MWVRPDPAPSHPQGHDHRLVALRLYHRGGGLSREARPHQGVGALHRQVLDASLLRLVCMADGEGRREDLEAWFRVESPVEPLLRGRDLLALGLKPGPELGRLLRKAYELQLELGLKTKEEVLEALGLAASL